MKPILFITLFFHAIIFASDDISTSISYIKLENKTYTFDEIKEKNEQNLFSPLEELHSKFGFTDNIFWVRAHIKNNSSKEQEQILEFTHPSLDYIDIYELKEQQFNLKKELGDLRVYAPNTFMPNPHYKISLLPFEEKIFFIQIHSSGTLNIGVNIQNIDDYNLSSSTQIKWLYFYFGAVLIMLMYNFIIYLIIKNRSFLYYVLFHVSYLIFALGLSGVAFELFWPNTPEINQYVLPIAMSLTCAFSLLFTIHFLDIKNINAKLYKYLYFFAILSFMVASLPLYAGYSLSIQLGSLFSLIAVLVLFILSFYLAIFKKNKNALFYLIAWIFFFLGVSIAHLSNIGIIPSMFLTSFSSQIGSFFEVLLLSVGLAYYYSRLKKEHIELTYRNNRLLKLSNTDMLTQSYNRRYFYNKVNQYLHTAKHHKSEFSLFVLDLDHFKSINDKYGHDIGDKVLLSFANICKSIISENDTFARIGGEEFAIFFPNTGKVKASKIAERIKNSVNDFKMDSEPTLNVTVSIGICGNILNLDELIEKADKALYKAKNSGRDTFIFHEDI